MKRPGDILEDSRDRKVVRYVDESGEIRTIEANYLFRMPLEIQQNILLRVPPATIDALCKWIDEFDEAPPDVMNFYDGICADQGFWRAKVRQDFPDRFGSMDRKYRELKRRYESFWTDEYAETVKDLEKMMPWIIGFDAILIGRMMQENDPFLLDMIHRYHISDYSLMTRIASDIYNLDTKEGRDSIASRMTDSRIDANRYMEELGRLEDMLSRRRIRWVRRALNFFSVNPNAKLVYDDDPRTEEVRNNRDDDNLFSALMLASEWGRTEIVSLLLDRGANPNYSNFVDARGRPIHKEVLAESLNAHPDEYERYEMTPMQLATDTQRDTKEIVRMLIEAGVDVNQRFRKNFTALSYAAIEGNVAVVEILLLKGAKVNASTSAGETALMLAAMHGRPGVVRVLLRNGADRTLRSTDGQTALDYARDMSIERIQRDDSEAYEETGRLLGADTIIIEGSIVGYGTEPEW